MKSKCTARKFPVRINCQSRKNKHTQTRHHIKWGHVAVGVKTGEEGRREEERGDLIARLGKQNELVLTTHLGICVLTLWQLEEPLKAAAAGGSRRAGSRSPGEGAAAAGDGRGAAAEAKAGTAAMGELLFCVRAKV